MQLAYAYKIMSKVNTLYSLNRIICITSFLAVFSVQAKDDQYKKEFVNRPSLDISIQQGIPFLGI